jgi:type II secretory pathway component PulJ
MKVIKAIYNFLVGDMIILTGVVIAIVLLALISYVGAFAALRVAIGPILIVAVLLSLFATLYREARGR